jgi:hypothetical protein
MIMRLDPMFINFIILGVVVFSSGASFFATVGHNTDIQDLILSGRQQAAERFVVQQEEDRKDTEEVALVKQVLQAQTARQEADNDRDNDVQNLILESLNNTRILVEQQGNLTKEQREKLVVALNENIEVIPILRNESEEMLNATNQMLDFIKFITQSFDEEYLIDEVRQYGQSNNTYGNITSIQDKLDTIIARGNGT